MTEPTTCDENCPDYDQGDEIEELCIDGVLLGGPERRDRAG